MTDASASPPVAVAVAKAPSPEAVRPRAAEISARALRRHTEVDELPADVIAIVAGGHSIADFHQEIAVFAAERELAAENGGQPRFSPVADQIWAIEDVGSKIACDRVFDLRDHDAHAAFSRISTPRDELGQEAPIFVPALTDAMRDDNERDGAPVWVPFPAQDVVDRVMFSYFNSSAAWAIAAAKYAGAKAIKLYGFDFTDARTRACCEFWFAVMAQANVAMIVPMSSSLTDANTDRKPIGFEPFKLTTSGPRFTP